MQKHERDTSPVFGIVREARRRREEADTAAHAEELRNANKRQRQEPTKFLKETESIERRGKREKEKEARETKKAEQRAKVEARKQAPADARALKLSQLGNNNASTPRPLKKKPNNYTLSSRCASSEVEEAPTETPKLTTRQGRVIQHSAGFK
ncbi:hypothetical protein DM02DRAFT_631319 [Periconia macrospinosa]|uniref:Uncharacterized protein n=1 Tax=Periconia macrospinosa TaxID=97972 RepID=A0A2V1DGS6_9PLEO|nr:hypothetical protein DM02DRAFT_631319 [Periconia macrospinosa]